MHDLTDFTMMYLYVEIICQGSVFVYLLVGNSKSRKDRFSSITGIIAAFFIVQLATAIKQYTSFIKFFAVKKLNLIITGYRFDISCGQHTMQYCVFQYSKRFLSYHSKMYPHEAVVE